MFVSFQLTHFQSALIWKSKSLKIPGIYMTKDVLYMHTEQAHILLGTDRKFVSSYDHVKPIYDGR